MTGQLRNPVDMCQRKKKPNTSPRPSPPPLSAPLACQLPRNSPPGLGNEGEPSYVVPSTQPRLHPKGSEGLSWCWTGRRVQTRTHSDTKRRGGWRRTELQTGAAEDPHTSQNKIPTKAVCKHLVRTHKSFVRADDGNSEGGEGRGLYPLL